MRARLRAHRNAVHAGEIDQPESQLVDDLQRALHRLLRLQRVDVGESRQARDLLVEARVVFHRARPEREETEVNRVILARQARVVTHGFGLAEAGQIDRARYARDCRAASRASARRQSRRRSARCVPISNSSGSSSISARLPVTVCASPCSFAGAEGRQPEGLTVTRTPPSAPIPGRRCHRRSPFR